MLGGRVDSFGEEEVGRGGLVSKQKTEAFLRAKRMAVAKPMPEAPPMITSDTTLRLTAQRGTYMAGEEVWDIPNMRAVLPSSDGMFWKSIFRSAMLLLWLS